MRRTAFREWLERLEEVPGTMELALAIALSGTVGVLRDGLRRVARLSPETLEDILAAMVAAGQVMVVQADGQRMYRATG
jgi:hypothetical protein